MWGTDSKKKKQIQIDIVGTPVEGKDYIIGSCKYRNEKIGVDELDLIRDYASVFGKGNKLSLLYFLERWIHRGTSSGHKSEVKFG